MVEPAGRFIEAHTYTFTLTDTDAAEPVIAALCGLCVELMNRGAMPGQVLDLYDAELVEQCSRCGLLSPLGDLRRRQDFTAGLMAAAARGRGLLHLTAGTAHVADDCPF